MLKYRLLYPGGRVGDNFYWDNVLLLEDNSMKGLKLMRNMSSWGQKRFKLPRKFILAVRSDR
jgi:hypothetical protein